MSDVGFAGAACDFDHATPAAMKEPVGARGEATWRRGIPLYRCSRCDAFIAMGPEKVSSRRT